MNDDFENLDRNSRIGAVIVFILGVLVVLTLITIFK